MTCRRSRSALAPAATLALAAALALAGAAPLAAQDAVPPAAPGPGEIVARAQPAEWVDIAPDDLLVMTLAPDPRGRPREVVIQLMPPPFSQGWVRNIRTLAKARWYDGLAIVRVQDNYVVQWGDPEGENPARAKPLPTGLAAMGVGEYVGRAAPINPATRIHLPDAYALRTTFEGGWPLAIDVARVPPDAEVTRPAGEAGTPRGAAEGAGTSHPFYAWPVHCYGMVGVGRNYSPDTGSGAELYTVIGHAPRHLDRNIALVGRVVEGIEHLSSLPRGTGELGFYKTPEERTPIIAVRVASELPAARQPRFQYLSTESESFARYAEARANRRDPFFIVPAGGADICNVPVPVRRVSR